ncbi:sugar ABC transporter substrate-binding protein [Lacisediminihabitans profunda]|uniref:Sugar ABC transporter substrate-binding protein n=1 Tax=Lacisediminihabitans profunda TaxID=2594790 RepID=A0A5C8UQ30_9MICO|nr:sugar ABC transporter substrate-binding protein [Lacisediminihabitans profunda]TXN30576.1 sugar ABC transporter substrate-binding protein [Lacisediminihabitans profunda]
MKKLRNMGVIAASTAALLTLAACSGTGTPSDGSTPRGGAESAIVKADIAKLAQYSNAKPSVDVVALNKKPPAGKTMDIINCAVPVCALYTKDAQQAAAALGWKTKVVTTQFTPESYTATWTSVVQDKPDVVFAAAVLPSALVKSQVDALHSAGAIVLTYAGDAPAGAGTPYTYSKANSAEQSQQGMVQGLIAVADAKAGPNVMFLAVPDTPSAAPTGAALKKVVEAAGGTFNSLNVNTADIGTKAPAEVVSFLQAHPAVKYVALPWDDWISGLPGALKSAGLSSIKVIGTAANATSEKDLQTGLIYRSIVHPTGQNAWFMIDAAVRQMVGDKVGDPNPAGPVSVVEPNNISAIGDASQWPHLDSLFKKAWRVG